MASVFVTLTGGSRRIVEGVSNVAEVRAKLGVEAAFGAQVNGDPVSSDEESRTDLSDDSRVSFTAKVKGGAAR